MREAFVRELAELAAKDRNTFLITGDLGFGVLTPLFEKFPAQCLNAGVAEQNMTALAVGMALEGKIVYTYSIANFPTLRCLEQIRNDACYHRANVKIVAVGGGFSYGPLGFSHHATEDLAVLRALPNMTVAAPGDPVEAEAATRALHETPGTCYLRLGRGGEPRVHPGEIDFKIGRAIRLFDGSDAVLISTGGILRNALEARERLSAGGRSVGLYSMHTLQPIDRGVIERLAGKTKWIVTIEEHGVLGGLGGAVSEILAETAGPKARLRRIGLRSGFSSIVGDQEHLRRAYGLSVDAIVSAVEEALALRDPSPPPSPARGEGVL